MIIYPFCTSLLKYPQVRFLAETYYRRKFRRPCFIMRQNERWTVVTIDM